MGPVGGGSLVSGLLLRHDSLFSRSGNAFQVEKRG